MNRMVTQQPLDSVGVDSLHSPFGESSTVHPDDITMVLCVRLHNGNPWIADRIDRMATYYSPCPPIVIVDFGSEHDKAKVLSEICERNGFGFHHVADYGVFSLATARNVAFEKTCTDFVFFCDPDFVSERSLFATLAATATDLNMREVIDIMLNPPAFHLSASKTEAFERLATPEAQSSFIRRASFGSNYEAVGEEEGEFVAPYSNVFLINRKMFSLVGGYDSNFRGHGSEDFEFLLRFAVHSSHLPLPKDPQEDRFAPLKSEFFKARPYVGFRRLLELMSQPTEGLGIKVFHLHHYREKANDWYGNNDWKRARFREATDKFLYSHHELLSIDYLTRSKKIACFCKNPDTWGYFLPLRLAGYEIVPVFDDAPPTIAAITNALVEGEIEDVAIFNPYMKSHSAFRTVVILAREMSRKVIVIERGALPGTIYYDDDVCYNLASYGEEAFEQERFSGAEIAYAANYIHTLRRGEKTLERMDPYDVTEQKYLALKYSKKKICFVPLQLDDDMAVTMFIKGEQRYPEFISTLPSLIERNPDVVFIIKPHPLSKTDNLRSAPNVILADREDNVHSLLDLASATICYNSGVGLLSLLHETPTITVGNAFYNLCGAGYRAASAAEGLQKFLSGEIGAPSPSLVHRLAAWFLLRKYSEFIATDNIREFATRKSHGYKDILVTRFRWKEHSHVLSRLKTVAPFAWTSYAASRIAPADDHGDREKARWMELEGWGRKDYNKREYRKAADLFYRAYQANPSRVNLLRFAAQAYFRYGNKREAIKLQKQAVAELPGNKRARLRLLVMQYPGLRFLIGKCEIEIR
ncbi:glycosyltransferase [Ensifer aridi]|uniref:capsular polysaccharide export protein, LipB/KpsS family n=1 Tax=Ensifer aridi TaxID=1708715 RepID=UPI00358E766B